MINSLSAFLPPIARVGLELRLGTGETRVDLHQLVTRADGEPALLVEHFRAGGTWPAGTGGDGLRAFLEAWSEEGSRFGDVFPQFYIEYDLVEDSEPWRTPCLFFDVHRRMENRAERAAREALIVEAIGQLYGGIARCRRIALERCFEAVEGRGSIGHLGVMLGRDGQPIRLNIKDLRRGALTPLLHELGWAGNLGAAEDAFNQLLDEADLVTVALDLFDEWLPVIGFEGFIKARPGADCRWRILLSRLCDEGLCTPAERRS
ncbi:MAG TPA: hypothetical protein VHX12_11970, partial [Acidisoma sp.]|nr:hypothetical protein [Acidisoma sp.]